MDIHKIRELKGKVAVLDNNVIIDFVELESMSLINSVFSSVYIPASIYEHEVTPESMDHLQHLEYSLTGIEKEESFRLFMEISHQKRSLTDYDVEVIVIAHEKAVLCSSNEKKIKQTCEEFGIEYTGTIGIIACAFEHKEISFEEFSYLIKKLFNDCSSWISPKLRREVMNYYKMEM